MENLSYSKNNIEIDSNSLNNRFSEKFSKKQANTLKSIPPQPNQKIDGFLNYLKNPCIIISNHKPKTFNETIILKNFDLKDFSTIEIIVTDLNSVIHELHPLSSNIVILTKDLRQKKIANDKFYSTFRYYRNFHEGELFKIQYLSNTEYKIIDSLEKIFILQKKLRCSFEDKYLYPEKNEYNVWKFLTKWNILDIDEKQRKYNEFACHELNLFIYFKDRVFFKNYILKFLQNKIQKTFVDLFLLNDQKQLDTYYLIENYNNLNVLEKILLIIYSIQAQKKEEAHQIYKFLENQNHCLIYDHKTEKNLFDIAIGSQPKSNKSIESSLSKKCESKSPSYNSSSFEVNSPKGKVHFTARKSTGTKAPKATKACKKSAITRRGFVGKGLGKSGAKKCVIENTIKKISSSSENSYSESSRSDSISEKSYSRKNSITNDYEEEFELKRIKILAEYKTQGKTMEYEERNYYNFKESLNLDIKEKEEKFLPNNIFWVDLAKHLIENQSEISFLSPNFIYCNTSHTSMLSALTFLDLSFEEPNHYYQHIEENSLEIKIISNCIVFTKEIKETQVKFQSDLLITQRFFDPRDKSNYFEENHNRKFLQPVDEYIIDKIYDCEVVITNSSMLQQEFQVYWEIPEGALPINSSDYHKSINVILESYKSEVLTYSFYFPEIGNFVIQSANISQNGYSIAIAQNTIFDVRKESISKKKDTMEQILSHGSKSDILNFVTTKNILDINIFDFNDIYYLLKDKEFYLNKISLLRQRKIYDRKTWAFSLYHSDMISFKEFINSKEIFIILKGKLKYLTTKLITIKNIRLLEYYPLTNSRAHNFLSDKHNILNKELKIQYRNFLEYLSEVAKPSNDDILSFVYYLLIQDRFDEALNIFNKINQRNNNTENGQLQYDYLLGYLNFYTGQPDFKIARKVCEKYLDYPILSWRNLFYEMANQLAEYDGEVLIDDIVGFSGDKQMTEKQKNLKLARDEENFNVELNHDEIFINYRNCKEININYYLIDLEVFFSKNPFILQGNDEFGFILPNFSERIELVPTTENKEIIVKIAEKYTKQNLFIQIKSFCQIKTLSYFSTSLKIQIIENYAQLKVTDQNNKPLSKVYVKIFCKNKINEVNFYKDGYTDLIGRFDYGSSNLDYINNVEKFSLLIMSDELGSSIREASPPSNLGKMSINKSLISDVWNKKAEERHNENLKLYYNS